MTTTTDAENKPTISGLIAPKSPVLALAPAPVLLALAPPTASTATTPATPAPPALAIPAKPVATPVPAATVTTISIPPTPSLRNQMCCKVLRTKVFYNMLSGAKTFGTIFSYCSELTCLHQPCINYRVNRKFELYKDAFGTNDIFFDRLNNTNDINIATIELKKLFRQYLVLDCFDHIEFFAAGPLNNKVNTSIFQTVNDYKMELLIALENHLVLHPHLSVTVVFDAKRVRHRHIAISKPSKKVATIEGYYASPGPNLGVAVGENVIFLPIEKVAWQVYQIKPDGTFDRTKVIDVGYQAARTVYKKQIADLHDFEVV